jgi:hypothetical protein
MTTTATTVRAQVGLPLCPQGRDHAHGERFHSCRSCAGR